MSPGVIEPRRLSFVVILLAVPVAGCQTVPIRSELIGANRSAKPVSVSVLQDKWGGVPHDPQALGRLRKIGLRLEAVIPRTTPRCVFELVGSAKLNAMCLENHIFVTRGLYDQLNSDDLVAAVLAHELAHIVGNDQMKRCRTQNCRLQKEIDADRAAVDYMLKAGFKPDAIGELLTILHDHQRPGWAKARRDALPSFAARSR